MKRAWWDNLKEEVDADYEEIKELLNKKGTVEMVCLLRGEPKRFDEIADEITVSRATLNKRRSQALDAGIIESVEIEVDGSLRRAYKLRGVGLALGLELRRNRIIGQYERLCAAQNEYERAKEEFLEFAEDEEDFLGTVFDHVWKYYDPVKGGTPPEQLREFPQQPEIDKLDSDNPF